MKVDWCAPSRREKLAIRIRSGMYYGPRDKIKKYNESLITINEIFSKYNFVFDPINHIFIDNNGKKHGIKTLISTITMKKYDVFKPKELKALSLSANYMMATIDQIKKELDEAAIKDRVKRVEEACDKRIKFLKKFPDIMNSLVGKYKSMYDENAYYDISTDPFDIFTQSTGRPWATGNCLRVFGQHEQGLYSDIEHFTAIVYIRDKRITGFDSAIARMSLRVCMINPVARKIKEKYSIGWDINWYRGNDTHDRYNIYSNGVFIPLSLTAKQATCELINIIQNHGFNVEYNFCKTPYVHEGYHDIEGTHHVPITYYSRWNYFCKKCGTPVKGKIWVKTGGFCPYHGRHPDAP